jgi:hypothetical protein
VKSVNLIISDADLVREITLLTFDRENGDLEADDDWVVWA